MAAGRRDRLGAARAGQFGRELDREARMDGRRADREEHRHRMDVEDVGGVDDEVRPAAQAGLGQGRMDGARREDRRERQPLEIEPVVGQEEDLGARRGSARRASDARRRGPPRGRPARRPRPTWRRVAGRRLPGVAHARRGARRGRPRSAGSRRSVRGPRGGPPRSAGRRPSSTRRSMHDPLALGVDGRVRDLRERLAQVVGDRPVQPAAAGGRRVVAHAPQGLVGLEGHRLDVEPGALRVEARRGSAAAASSGSDSWASARAAASARSSWIGRGASWIGSARSARAFASVSSRISAAAGLDQQQLARAQSPAPDRVRGRERHRARLGGDRDQPVAGDRERRRPQPVAVDQRADPHAVGEDDGRRPVPRREEPGGPAAERRDVRMRRATERQRLGDRGEQGRRQLPAGRHQQLERLVERERVGAVGREQRAGGQEVGRDRPRTEVARSGRGPARGCRGPC